MLAFPRLLLLCLSLPTSSRARFLLSAKPTPTTSSSLPIIARKTPPKQPPTATEPRGGSHAVGTLTSSQLKLLNLFSGGFSGTLASCITNPLEVIKTQIGRAEVIKTQLQSSSAAVGELSLAAGRPLVVARTILRTEGFAGFFRGLPPTLVGIVPSRSAYFYSYERCKRGLGPVLPEGSVGNALLSGLAAGIAANTLTNPLWVVKTRMQLLADRGAGQRVYEGYGDAVRTIWGEEGLGGFYKGISASYWGCAEGAVQFMLYEQIKSRFFERMNRRREEEGKEPTDKLPQMVYFFSAAIAKGTASVITYPHEVARTRLREQARNGVFKYKGMWQTIGIVAKEEGRKGLYGGMGVHLMKVVPNSAIMFLTYEIVNAWLDRFTIVDD
ncbi:hypothetical protein ACHAW6_005772 [Cyclotella cf. meneghiniana]